MSILEISTIQELRDGLDRMQDRLYDTRFVVVPTNKNKPSYEVRYVDGYLKYAKKILPSAEIDITDSHDSYGIPAYVDYLPTEYQVTLYGEGNTKIVYTDFSLSDAYVDSYIERLDIIREWGFNTTKFKLYSKNELLNNLNNLLNNTEFKNQTGFIILADKTDPDISSDNTMLYMSL